MQPVKIFDDDRPFEGALQRISGRGVELIDHATDALWADRPLKRCNADGCGDVSIDLMVECTEAMMINGVEAAVRPSDACLIDYSRPVQIRRSRHRTLALMLPRRRVIDTVGEQNLARLAGAQLSTSGIAALLRAYLRKIADGTARFDRARRVLAMDAAANLALVALQAEFQEPLDVDQFGDALYLAARMTIRGQCADPAFRVERVAELIGCSRASLYRLFTARGESVAHTIWLARLERAHALLVDPAHGDRFVSEIAFRCGFTGSAAFSRIFKRRYGMTPSEVRAAAMDARRR
jgi:AraC-like DNA-binding protein